LPTEVNLQPIFDDIQAMLTQLRAAPQTPDVQQAIASLETAQKQVAAACPFSMLINIP
jgi:hypothetical protein